MRPQSNQFGLSKATARKLMSYSAAAGLGAFAFGSDADGAIVLTDVPDTTVGPGEGSFDLDFDGDGFVDAAVVSNGLSMQFRSFGFDEIVLGVWDVDNFTLTTFPNGYYTQAADPGTLFDANSITTGSKSGFGFDIGIRPPSYNFIGTGDFVGFQFEIGNDPNETDGPGVDRAAGSTTHFAWLRVDGDIVNNNAVATILSFAYETDPDTGIVAGDTGTAPLLGDANKDGQVTGADLISVQQNFGNVGPVPLQGDANNDGQVTGADLISVQQNFGNVSATAAVPVPEPTTLGLLAVGAPYLLRRRHSPAPALFANAVQNRIAKQSESFRLVEEQLSGSTSSRQAAS